MPRGPSATVDGGKIRTLRIRRGLTPAELAELAKPGRAGQTIRDLERKEGKRASLVLVSQIANALGVPPSELIIDQDGDAA